MERSAVIDKIIKLQRQADDRAVTPEEAEAFAAKVQSLAAKYKIDVSTLDMDFFFEDNPIARQDISPTDEFKQRRDWFAEALTRTLTTVNECDFYVRPGTNWLVLVGYASDRETVEYLLQYLYRAATTHVDSIQMRVYNDFVKAGNRAGFKGFRKSFLEGFARAIDARLKAEKEAILAAARGAGQSTAIVPVSQANIQKWVADNMKIGKGYSVGNGGNWNSRGYAEGEAYGKSINIKGGAGLPGKDRERLEG